MPIPWTARSRYATLLFEGVDVALRLQRPLPSSWQGGPVNTLRWKFTYDDVDFDGLRLQTLGAGGEVLTHTWTKDQLHDSVLICAARLQPRLVHAGC